LLGSHYFNEPPVAMPLFDQEIERRHPGAANQPLREALKLMYDELEDTTSSRPGRSRSEAILNPDIDTQDFIGDIMFSNTYLTQRVPANWDDPE
jgi:hypothetical protein